MTDAAPPLSSSLSPTEIEITPEMIEVGEAAISAEIGGLAIYFDPL